jgi:hypothetical protein
LLVAIAAVLAAVGLASCRVGPFRADALTEPFPDGALDHGARDVAGVDGAQPCDLLVQICANDPKDFCYPVDGVPGATQCQPNGSGPVLSQCVSNLDCDGRETCQPVPEAGGLPICVTICDPSAATPGCPPKAPCRLIPGYRAGYCVP